MKAIIVGAGRGLRLMPETAALPKTLLPVGGRPVLDWILEAFRRAGIKDVIFVGGYQMDRIIRAYPQLRFYHNLRWAETNILASLLCAEPELDTAFVFTYSDILFRAQVVRQLLAQEGDIVLVVDRQWTRRYQERRQNPESAAEKVLVEDGRVVKVGKRVAREQAYGEFVGLAKFSQGAAQLMRAQYSKLQKAFPAGPFHEASNLQNAYVTDMLQELIGLDVRVEPSDIQGGWTEIDTEEDLALARAQWPARLDAS